MPGAIKRSNVPRSAAFAKKRAILIGGRDASTSTLAIALGPQGQLPTEFRLFVAGWNDTENGKFLFDAAAARETLAAYAKWGVDIAIDLEHQMLDPDIAPDPTAKDARGWCNLELRPDGSLWATNVSWTPDGAARLTEKRQRYISPAFGVDPETSRVTSILNIAITSIPATHDTPALVAASATPGASAMDPKLITEALDALMAGDADKCMDLLKGVIAAAAGGSATMDAAPPSSSDGGPVDSGDTPVANAAAAPPPPPEKKAEVVAAASRLMRLTGAASFVDAIAVVENFRESHMKLETETQKLAVERATLENAERRKGCADLVTLGGRAPATVWADDKANAPKKYLASMPMADFREYVSDAIKASAGTKTAPKTPASNASGAPSGVRPIVELSAAELQICEDLGCKPEVFATLKTQRDSVTKTGGT